MDEQNSSMELAPHTRASAVRLFFALLGDIIAFLGLIITLYTMWHFVAAAVNLLVAFLIALLCSGPWLVIMAVCSGKVVNYFQDRARDLFDQRIADEYVASIADRRRRENESHATELHLKRTRLAANEQGNRDYIYEEVTGRIISVEGGNFIQPVPHSIHYSYKADGGNAIAPPEKMLALPAGRSGAPTLDEICSQVQRNSGMICLGRSLKANPGELVTVELRGSHILLIGSTQKGKSTQAAAIMEQLTRTHDREHLLLALLDLEDQTCNLFADAPHVARIGLANGRNIKAIARSPQEVAQYLAYLVDLMEARYELSPRERAELPRVVIYLEEFLELKRQLKGNMLSKMADDFTSLATRGLKANMHLMVCAQASYSQEEFREAMGQLVGINMGFCAPPKLAQAAGFWDYASLKENYLAKVPGQFVLEATGITDLCAAPDYQLQAKLRGMQEREEARLSAPGAHTSISEVQEQNDEQNKHRLIALQSGTPMSAHLARTPNAQEGAHQDIPAWEGYLDAIERLQEEGHNQDEIIEKIWHAKKGSGNQKYLNGREIYRMCNEHLKARRQVAYERYNAENGREAM